jgi:hypothetical protein
MSFQADAFQNDAFQIDRPGGGSSAWMWGYVKPEVSRRTPFRPIWDREKPLPPPPAPMIGPKGEARLVLPTPRLERKIQRPTPQPFDDKSDARDALAALHAAGQDDEDAQRALAELIDADADEADIKDALAAITLTAKH